MTDAKVEEIEKWTAENVFDEVPDKGQNYLTTTWVITTKRNKDEISTKARLVVRGYEEQNSDIRSDSPTCMRENVRILLALAVAKKWVINSLDVKSAFLQGKRIERDLYILPPKDFRKGNTLWKLNKVVYGLCDASRNWYLRVLEVLNQLQVKETSLDKSVFVYRTQEIEGIILIHVDDILYFGSERFLSRVMDKFKTTFQISRNEAQAFKYLGIQMRQKTDCVEMNQNEYLESISPDLVSKEKMIDKERFANEIEKRAFKQGVGQIGWMVSISKPEAAFSYCNLSVVQSRPRMKDFFKFKKLVNELGNYKSFINIHKINLNELKISVFSDASFGNLADGSSQLGFIIFMQDNADRVVPISWASKKCKRVARSTLTAETLAALEAVDAAMASKAVIEEILDRRLPPVNLYIDNKSLFDTARTSNVLSEKRLMIDMSALRQMIDRSEVIIEWVSTENQVADILTKD